MEVRESKKSFSNIIQQVKEIQRYHRRDKASIFNLIGI
jgi:hypothetical protein